MKFRRYLVAGFMGISFSVMAQQNRVDMMLWDENVGADQAKAIVEKADFNRDPAITVYKAAKPNGKAIIMCPGGGYGWEATGHEGHDIAHWLNNQGVTYVVLKYRLPQGNHEIPLSDAEQAIRLVREHAEEWGVDPSKVGIMGASAGGHLASTVATHYTSAATRPDFQILFYPVITMDPSYTHAGSRTNLLGENPSADLQNRFSNELQVTPDTPKAFLILSSDDDIVPVANSINYYTSLVSNKVPVAMHIYPNGGHGYGYSEWFTYKDQWKSELEKWLREEI